MNVFGKQKAFLDLFPAPEYLLLSTAGIAITDNDTKFAQLRREIFGDGFRLSRLSKTSNPKGAIELGLIKDSGSIANILKGIASRFGVRYAHAILPEEKAYLFTTSVAWASRENLEDAVAFILEENAPVSLAESVFDFEVIDEDHVLGKIKLAVSVLPKNIIDSYVELFESAGITPVSFDLKSQAVARAVIKHGDKQPYLIVYLSLNKTGFYVVEKEVVQFSTTAFYGVGEDDLYPGLNDLKAEMRKVLAFWDARADPLRQSSSEASGSGKKIEKIILCGLGAGRDDFVGKLMGESSVGYALADVWQNMSPSHSHTPEISAKESLDYASAIGLVLPRNK